MTNQKQTRDSFIFYRSFYDASRCLKTNEKAQLFDAICSYALDEKIEQLDGTAYGMFQLVKPQLDANRKRYINGLKGAEHGSKGGRPVENNPKKTPNLTPKKPQDNPKITPNITPNENDNENDNVNDNENVNQECKLESINHNHNSKTQAISKTEASELDLFCDEVVIGLKEILSKKLNRNIATSNWSKEIKLIVNNDLKIRGEQQAKQDLIRCIQAIENHYGKDYFPIIQSAKSLREKLTKIENYLERTPQAKKDKLEEDFMEMVNNNKGEF